MTTYKLLTLKCHYGESTHDMIEVLYINDHESENEVIDNFITNEVMSGYGDKVGDKSYYNDDLCLGIKIVSARDITREEYNAINRVLGLAQGVYP